MDVFTKAKRSWIMARVHGRDTKPERVIRSLIHRMGFRFRLQGSRLPGKPDVVLTRHRKVIYIHGCFWHGHARCSRATRPTSNTTFWNKKLDRNISRDKQSLRAIRRLGWKALVIWQCEILDPERVALKLRRFLEDSPK